MSQRFDATLVVHVVVPLGGGGRIPVLATFDGVEYRGSVVTMGGERVIAVQKAIRGSIAKADGDAVAVTLARDETRARRVAKCVEMLQK